MKMAKSILMTFLCALIILVAGYLGIIFSGTRILKNPAEPEQVNMSGNISKLFYSNLEDDIQLYPWNYYQESNQEGTRRYLMESDEIPMYMEYAPHLEYEVIYNLIALAANVEPWDVSQWYISQNKSILEGMVRGVENGTPLDLFFYEEVIRLNGKDYQVRISTDLYGIISFSCIRCREENIKETEEWKEQKEEFIEWLENEQEEVRSVFELTRSYVYDNVGYLGDCYWYVSLYGELQQQMQQGNNNIDENAIISIAEKEKEKGEKEEAYDHEEEAGKNSFMGEDDSIAIQMIEMKDSILLVMESDFTIGIYYDVLEQRISGLHFL